MASIYKRGRREPVPASAQIVERDGQRYAQWLDPKGKLCEAPLSASGKMMVLPPDKNDAFWISFIDPATRLRKQLRGYTDREATEAMARRLERDAARRAEGLIDPFEEHLRTPIGQIIDDFIGGIRAARASQVRHQVETLVAKTGVARLHQLDTPAVERALNLLQKENDWSDATYNEYVIAIKRLTRWAVINRRLPSDPLGGLQRIKPKAMTPRHPRAALTLEQLGRLLVAAEQRPERELLTVRRGQRKGQLGAKVRPRILERARKKGKERRLCYMLAFWLRLRRRELAQLEWGDINLASTPACVRLRAHTTKARRGDTIPIHDQARDELLKFWHKGIDPRQKVLRTVPDMKAFRADLAAAGIPDRDVYDAYIDLHALGKSFITAMHANGVSQRAAQSLARHTDPRLTAKTYTDEALLPLASELAKVPSIPMPPSVGNVHAQSSQDGERHEK